MTEESLMAAYCDGDRRAFEQLFALLGPRVHGFFMRSCKSEALADDLLQTTFVNVHRARNDYRRDLPVRPWVFTIATRVLLDEYRRQKRVVEEPGDEAMERAQHSDGAADGATQGLEAGERAARVRAALGTLPESQRVIVHLHRFEGMSFPDIARALGTTEGAVRLRAFRAYERLRKQLRPLRDREAGE